MILEKIDSNNAQEVVDFKMKFGHFLPDDYIEFVSHNNGVRVSDAYFYVETLNEYIMMGIFFGISSPKYNLMTVYDEFNPDIPADSLIIGMDPGGGFILLICNGINNGVYYYDHSYFFDLSCDDNNTYFIADTFSDFLNLLSSTKPNAGRAGTA
ncbi:SMI1/KNR4 family protein [Salmonella enterica]|nr:SMI1/KNR4 family protein [Salmonella enterica]